MIELDLAKLEPYVVGPHTPDRARPISVFAAEIADATNAFVDDISTALIGSCTNSSGVAVIARSFARIHESNLKKQGLLALTFQNADDYDRIREDDRISLIDLAELAPGEPVDCVVRHADGTTEFLSLAHSFSAAQLEWFRAGAALNLVRGR